MTLSTRLRAWVDRLDCARGRALEPLPLLAGTPAAEAVEMVLALGDDERWYNALGAWFDPSLGLWLDAHGNLQERACAVVRCRDAGAPELGAFQAWADRQLARGAVDRTVPGGQLAVVTPGAPWHLERTGTNVAEGGLG